MKTLHSVLVFSAALIVGITENCDDYSDNPAVARMQKYIQIDTSNPDNLEHAVEFWRQQAQEINLPITVYKPAGLPVVVITWEGLDLSLPSIMLNSHMDVVGADAAQWKFPPFSGHIDENGDIYGRGMQDTKDIAIQYLEAIRSLKKDNIALLRTLHITVMPDEELGGDRGMKAFMKTDDFKLLNIGFALDEGFSSKNDTLLAFYEDRRPWQMEIKVFGEAGHGFTMPEDPAVEKAHRLIGHALELRHRNIKIMKSLDSYDYGKYTSMNINVIKAGTVVNVIPADVTIAIDMRLSSDSNVTQLEHMIQSWMDDAGNNTDIHFIRREEVSEKTVLDHSNSYWVAMKQAVEEMGYDIVTLVCPATTDMMPLRNIGIPAVGFAPKLRTTSKIHGRNEYLNIDTFLNGIKIYYEILKKVGNVPDNIIPV